MSWTLKQDEPDADEIRDALSRGLDTMSIAVLVYGDASQEWRIYNKLRGVRVAKGS